MSKPMIRIHNTATNEIIDREMNAEELAVYDAEVALFEAKKAAAEKAASEKSVLLEKLGITEDEAKLLLG